MSAITGTWQRHDIQFHSLLRTALKKLASSTLICSGWSFSKSLRLHWCFQTAAKSLECRSYLRLNQHPTRFTDGLFQVYRKKSKHRALKESSSKISIIFLKMSKVSGQPLMVIRSHGSKIQAVTCSHSHSLKVGIEPKAVISASKLLCPKQHRNTKTDDLIGSALSLVEPDPINAAFGSLSVLCRSGCETACRNGSCFRCRNHRRPLQQTGRCCPTAWQHFPFGYG